MVANFSYHLSLLENYLVLQRYETYVVLLQDFDLVCFKMLVHLLLASLPCKMQLPQYSQAFLRLKPGTIFDNRCLDFINPRGNLISQGLNKVSLFRLQFPYDILFPFILHILKFKLNTWKSNLPVRHRNNSPSYKVFST